MFPLPSFHDIWVSSEFWSAIVGAVAGGFFSMALQLLATRAQSAERKQAEARANQVLAASISWKLIHITQDLYRLYRDIEEPFIQHGDDAHRNPWRLVMTRNAYPAPITFDDEERALFLTLKNDRLAMDALNLERHHQDRIDVRRKFDECRTELAARMKYKVDGDQVRVLPPDDVEPGRLDFMTIQANALVTSMRKPNEEAYYVAKSALEMFQDVAREKLGFKGRIILPFDPGRARHPQAASKSSEAQGLQPAPVPPAAAAS